MPVGINTGSPARLVATGEAMEETPGAASAGGAILPR